MDHVEKSLQTHILGGVKSQHSTAELPLVNVLPIHTASKREKAPSQHILRSTSVGEMHSEVLKGGCSRSILVAWSTGGIISACIQSDTGGQSQILGGLQLGEGGGGEDKERRGQALVPSLP